MITFITENIGSIIVFIVVAAIIGFAIYKQVKNKKNGNSCGCGCSGCSGCSSCESKDKSNK